MYKEETELSILKKILIVEDDLALCQLLKKKLGNLYELQFTHSISESISCIIKAQPALLCLDYSLQDGSAAELVKQLDLKKITIPFIVITGHSDIKLAVEMMKLGAIDIIVKDEYFTGLINTVIEKTFKFIENELKVAKLQKALAISEVRYEHLFENAANAYLVLQNGKIVQCNKKAMQLLGYEKHELLGKSPLDFKPAKQPDGQGSKIQLLNGLIEVEKGIEKSYDTVYQKKDKTFFLATVTANKIALGDTILIVAEITDVTDKKNAEKALKESEKKYRVVAEKTTDVIWLLDLEGKSIFVTQSIEQFTGYTVEEYLNQTIKDRFTPESAEYGIGIFSKELMFYRTRTELLKDYKISLELEYVCKNGATKWGELIITPLYNDDNILIGVHGVTHDITERRTMHKALRKSEEKFRGLVESSSDIIWETNTSDKYTYISPQVYKTLGYTSEELIGKFPFETMPDWEKTRMKKISTAILDSQKPFENIENTHTHKNGTPVIFETSGIPFFNENGYLLGYRGVDRDITEKKLAKEKELSRYKSIEKLSKIVLDIVESPIEYNIYKVIAEQLHVIVENSVIIVSKYDLQSVAFEVRAIHGLGKSSQKVMHLVGSEVVGRMFSDSKKTLQELLTGKLIKTNESLYQVTLNKIPEFICNTVESLLNIKEIYRIGITLNKEIFGSISILCIKNKLQIEPELIEIYASQISVIMKKRRTEIDLREREERYRELFNNANDLVYTHDLFGNFKSYNDKASEILGIPKFNIETSLHLKDILDEEEYLRAFEKIRNKEEGKNIFTNYELEVKGLNGNKVLLEISSTMRYKAGKPYEIFGIARDVTERRKLERVLQKNYDNQDIISSILRLSLENISLNDFLLRSLEIITQVSGLVTC